MCRIYWEHYDCGCILILDNSLCCQIFLDANPEICNFRDMLCVPRRQFDWSCFGLELEGCQRREDCSCCSSNLPCQALRRWRMEEEQWDAVRRVAVREGGREYRRWREYWGRFVPSGLEAMRQSLGAQQGTYSGWHGGQWFVLGRPVPVDGTSPSIEVIWALGRRFAEIDWRTERDRRL